MIASPMMINELRKDTVDNLIIKAMIDGKNQISIDQSENHIGRCRDEKSTEEQLIDSLKSRGFNVSRLHYMKDNKKVYSGFVVKFGE